MLFRSRAPSPLFSGWIGSANLSTTMRWAVNKIELPKPAATRSAGECKEFEHTVAAKFMAHAAAIHCRTDVMFAILMQLQWIGAIIAAGFVMPFMGADPDVSRINMLVAVFGGGGLAGVATALAVLRPGKLYTRMVIGVCQVLFSSLLLHLTNGQLGTAFHIFGSLAFLAAYRDWRVLGPPTVIVAIERFIRGHWWPHMLYGLALSSEWRWLEVVAWVLFADVFLFIIIRQSIKEMYKLARHTAELEEARTSAEQSARAIIESHEEIRKLSLVASKARHPVIITNAAGQIEWANEALAEHTEFTTGEVIGQELCSLFDDLHTDPAVVRTLQERMNKAKSTSTELIHYSKSGREHWVSLELDPVFDENGALTNFIATQADITERKRYEEQLRKASLEAESANRAKSQFLANMSHEIRTPLNGILGFTEILLRGKSITDEERQDYLRTIASSGKHLLMLINDVLDLSKIEAGQLQVEHLECSPHQIIAEVISVLRVHAQEKSVGLEYRWESGIPETIQTDSHRLKQLLMNLVGNAVKFTQQGRVMVVAKLVTEGIESKLWIEVRDTGIGIPTDKLATVFEPFVQADSSITRKHGGTGLGLAICRNIAEALGGQVWATSEMGVGSTFFVTITTGDLAGVTILEQPPQAVTGDVRRLNTDAIRLDGLNVLLADDGDTNRRLIHILLSRHGANVGAGGKGKNPGEKSRKQRFDNLASGIPKPGHDG